MIRLDPLPGRAVLLVTGSREVRDEAYLAEVIGWHWTDWAQIVRHGDNPRGADALTRKWCERMNSGPMGEVVTHDPMPADWNRYRRSAGPIRNRAMAAKEPPIGLCAAFFRVGAANKGTTDMVQVCENLGIPVERHWTE